MYNASGSRQTLTSSILLPYGDKASHDTAPSTELRRVAGRQRNDGSYRRFHDAADQRSGVAGVDVLGSHTGDKLALTDRN